MSLSGDIHQWPLMADHRLGFVFGDKRTENCCFDAFCDQIQLELVGFT